MRTLPALTFSRPARTSVAFRSYSVIPDWSTLWSTCISRTNIYRRSPTLSFAGKLLQRPLISIHFTAMRRYIAILLFAEVEILDFAGPFAVFAQPD